MVRFAYGEHAHAPVIGEAKRGDWLPESWFARGLVVDSVGSWPGLDRLVQTG